MYIDIAMWLIKLGTAITMVSFGIHQARHPEKWLHFMPAFMLKSSAMKPTTSMRSHALGNIVFGLFLAFPLWSTISAAVCLIWWVSILPFAWKVDWHIGIRDLTICAGLGALLLLSL